MLRRVGAALEPWWSRLLVVVIVGDVFAGVFLRFRTTSKLWLDEALSVNIARHGLSGIVDLLRHDGAPPLYYFLLHFWMKLAGTSDLAVRSLSGVCGVAAVAVMYVVAKEAWDAQRAKMVAAIGSVLPFTVYYSTETRMYSLVVLEVAVLALLLVRLQRHPGSRADLVGLSLTVTALLYTQYWSIYLMASLVAVAAFQWIRQLSRRQELRRQVLAYVVGGLLWLPWLPIFNSQRLHTGTPWARHPQPFQFIIWPVGMWVNQSVQHVSSSLHFALLSLAMVIVMTLGVFAVVGRNEQGILLKIRPEGEISFYAIVGATAIFFGMLACDISDSAYAPRYSSIVAVLFVFVIARGVATFGTPQRVFLALSVISVLLLWTDKWGIGVQRTQAGVAAHAIAAQGDASGSLIAVCPDQVGPSLSRYVGGNPEYVLYPRLDSNPRIVDWYDYPAALASTTPEQAADAIARRLKPHQTLYIAWATGYTLKSTCETFANALQKVTHRQPTTLVVQNMVGFYQSMTLVRLPG
jgi:hypothetical protein